MFVLAAIAVALNSYGKSRRTYTDPPQMFLVERYQAYEIWKLYGVRGRILYIFGRNLGWKEDDGHASKSNYVYLSVRDNIVREVRHVESESIWQKVSKRFEDKPYFHKAGRWAYRSTLNGSPLTVLTLDEIRPVEEKVLVIYDESSWNYEERLRIESLFLEGVLKADIMIVEGHGDVSGNFGNNNP